MFPLTYYGLSVLYTAILSFSEKLLGINIQGSSVIESGSSSHRSTNAKHIYRFKFKVFC